MGPCRYRPSRTSVRAGLPSEPSRVDHALQKRRSGEAFGALPAVEALITHGEDGWLVPPDDPAALTAGLNQVLADPALAARLGAAAAGKVLTWEQSNQLVLDAYTAWAPRSARTAT